MCCFCDCKFHPKKIGGNRRKRKRTSSKKRKKKANKKKDNQKKQTNAAAAAAASLHFSLFLDYQQLSCFFFASLLSFFHSFFVLLLLLGGEIISVRRIWRRAPMNMLTTSNFSFWLMQDLNFIAIKPNSWLLLTFCNPTFGRRTTNFNCCNLHYS